jgi:hypothetical protein
VADRTQALGKGRDPSCTATRNLLALSNVRMPHDGNPFSEAMTLGLGNGLGVGYILWEFAGHTGPILTLNFVFRWQYPTEAASAVLQRVAGKLRLHDAAAICLVDKGSLPFLGLPEYWQGRSARLVTVTRKGADAYAVYDLSPRPFMLSRDKVTFARSRTKSYKHRFLTSEHDKRQGGIDLAKESLAAIATCAEHLGQESESFALPALRKWSRLLVDKKQKKAWPVLFREPSGLPDVLASLYGEIRERGGGGLRDLYADFLDETSRLTGKQRLTEAAKLYRACAAQWNDLAERALPDSIPDLLKIKEAIRQYYAALTEGSDQERESLPTLMSKIVELTKRTSDEFPLSKQQVEDLLENMSEAVSKVFDAENAALDALRAAIH